MTHPVFVKYLLLVTAGAILTLAAADFVFPVLAVHRVFAAVTLVFFVLLCLALYLLADMALRSQNKYAFTNLISASVFVKMVASLFFLLAWRKIHSPVNQAYVGIFLWCYLIYTLFEVWFMTRMARTQKS